MRMQKYIIWLTVIITVLTLGIYCIMHFIIYGINQSAVIVCISQIAISISTGAFVTCLVAIVTYYRAKKGYLETVAKEFRTLFDVVDDYLVCIEHKELYFNEYYSFRSDFMNHGIIGEREIVYLTKKEEKVLKKAMEELYLLPKNMVYYSFKKVKQLEYKYNSENKHNSKIKYKYYLQLEESLKEMNTYLLELKCKNAYNRWATIFYRMAGIDEEEGQVIDDYETEYRKQWYSYQNI